MGVGRVVGGSGASSAPGITFPHPGFGGFTVFRIAVIRIASTATISLPAGGAWTTVLNTTSGLGSTGRLLVATRWQDDTDTAAQSFTWTSTNHASRCNSYSGVDPTTPWVISPAAATINNGASGTTLTGAAITPDVPDSYGIWVYIQQRTSNASTATITPPASFDLVDTTVRPPSGGNGVALSWAADTTMPDDTSSGTRVATSGPSSGASGWCVVPMALRAAVTVTGPEPGRRIQMAA
jgi:hypothetical protein